MEIDFNNMHKSIMALADRKVKIINPSKDLIRRGATLDSARIIGVSIDVKASGLPELLFFVEEQWSAPSKVLVLMFRKNRNNARLDRKDYVACNKYLRSEIELL